jgi:8-oxo-dGTP pyrophosphatase MutT (NUDIX family)
MIKEVSYAAYIIPVRMHNGKKQIAILNYAPGAYGTIGGRFDDGETTAKEALRRELREELGEKAEFMVELAEEVKEHYKFKVHESRVEKRGAYNEEHIFFIVEVPESTDLEFCEEREECIKVEWLDSEALVDEKIIGFPDQRAFLEQNVMPIIRKI